MEILNSVIKTNDYRKIFFSCLLLTLLLLLPYSQVRNHQFVDFDDYYYIVENPHIKHGMTVDGLRWAFGLQNADEHYWRPLTWVSHMLDFELFGNDAGWHHLMNLSLHLLNTLLLYALLLIMTGRSNRSAIVAALFALHPINVESVAWVTERNNVLSTALGLITLLCYVLYTLRPSLLKYLVVFLSFLLCLMAKPILVTLPFLMLLLDLWPLNRFGHVSPELPGRKMMLGHIIGEKAPLIVLSFLAIWFSLQRHGGSPISVEQVSMQLRLSNAVVAYVQYLINLIYPLELAAYYPFPKVIPIWKILGAIFVLLSVSGAVTFWLKKVPYLFVGWFWFTGTLFPNIGLVQLGMWPALADRWAYFPAIGLFVLISWGLIDLLENKSGIFRKGLIIILVAACSVTVFLTWKQVGYWANSTRLFERMLEKTKNNDFAHNNLGLVLVKQGKLDEAERHYLKAIDIDPNVPNPYLNIGVIADKNGDLENAQKLYEKAITIDPDYYDGHLTLGGFFLKQGNYQKSSHHYAEAIRINSGAASPYNGFGVVLMEIGRSEDGIKMFQQALEIDPEYKPAIKNLARGMEVVKNKKNNSDNIVESIQVE